MKKKLILAIALGLVVSSINTTCYAGFMNSDKGIISVNSSAETEVVPDTVEISFTVKTYDINSMQKATLANKEISDRVFSKLKTFINTDSKDYIKTSDFSANPVYSYVNSKKVFEKYEVSNKVIVKTKSIDKIGAMIDNAIELGATNVENLSFSISNYESQCDELISIATKKAKKRGEIIANSLNTKLLGVNNLSSSCSTNNYAPPRLYMAKNMIADVATEASAVGTTPISNGTIKINSNVNATFFVK